MINKRFNKGIEEIQKVGLTPLEKSAMLKRIAVIQSAPAVFKAPIKSPWKVRTFTFVNRYSTTVVAAALVAMISGGALSYAAERTLPGDFLYTFKTGVTEPLQGLFTFSETDKAQFAEQIVNKRLDEEERLAVEGKLDPVKQIEVRESIDMQVKNLDTTHQTRIQENINTRLQKIDGIVRPRSRGEPTTASVPATSATPATIAVPASAKVNFGASTLASTTLTATTSTSTTSSSTTSTSTIKKILPKVIVVPVLVPATSTATTSASSTASVSASSTPKAVATTTVTNTVNSLVH